MAADPPPTGEPGELSAAAPTAGVQLPAEQAWRRARFGWLAGQSSPNTRQAYAGDTGQWTGWLADHAETEPWEADRTLAAGWRHHLGVARQLAPATIARKLAACSSLYEYALDEGAVDTNPFARLDRPRVAGDAAAAAGLARLEAAGLLAAAGEAGPRDHAAVCLLVLNGLRASELCELDVTDLDVIRGYRVVRSSGKGGRQRVHRLADRTAAALQAHRAGREAGPLVLDNAGGRLNRHQLARLVARLGNAAGLDADPTPHTLRHTAATMALDAGAALRDVQDMLGHRDPATTRRYDRAAHSLDRHPTEQLAIWLGKTAP